MKSMTRFALISAIALALAYVVAGMNMDWPERSVIKFLPIVILAILSWMYAPGELRRPLALAFVFSAMGDWTLSAPYDHSFLMGMAAFFAAQLAFIWTYLRRARPLSELDLQRWLAIGLIAIFVATMAAIILPRTGSLAVPVAVYYLAVSLMAITAFIVRVPRWTRLGALLFLLSDSLIGADKFLAPIEHRHLLIMGSYYLGQFLIFTGLVQMHLQRQKDQA